MMLSSIKELLQHIKEVEQDSIEMSKDSMMVLSTFIEKNNLAVDEDAAKALQYQDIISQQLSATIEAIESVQKSIEIFENAYKSDEQMAQDSIAKLRDKLDGALNSAKDRRSAFSGTTKSDEDSIEFF